MNHNEIIKYPLLTEKSYKTMAENVYVFAVDERANKIEIKKAIEFIFQVKVEKINVYNVPKKPKKVGRFDGFTNSFKKAYIYLKEGKINIFPEDLEEDKKSTKRIKKEKSDSELKIEEKVAAKIAAKTKTSATKKVSEKNKKEEK